MKIERMDYLDGDGISVDYLCCVDREDLDKLEAENERLREELEIYKAALRNPTANTVIRASELIEKWLKEGS